MRAHEFLKTGVLYLRSWRDERTLMVLLNQHDDWTTKLITGSLSGAFHVAGFRCRWLECADGPEYTAASGDTITIAPATDEDIRAMFSAWTKANGSACFDWSLERFCYEMPSIWVLTPENIDRLRLIARPFLEVKHEPA